MIIQTNELDAYEAFLDEYEENTVFSRALELAIEEFPTDRDPREFARAVISRLPPGPPAPINTNMKTRIYSYLRKNPQLLVPSGFDEIRIETNDAKAVADSFREEFLKKGSADTEYFEQRISEFQNELEFMLGLHVRDLASGIWYKGARIDLKDYSLFLRASEPEAKKSLGLRDILSNCRAALVGGLFPAAVTLPRLWYPPNTHESILLVDTSREIVKSLSAGKTSLTDLSWQQLEDVVAELLRMKGLEISCTTRSADGGRDIIARGELVPGETVIMAVEVKHRAKVGVHDVRAHIYANREFPVLLVATSGKFTAGVVAEKKKPENFMRLHLRDGAAIKEWIDSADYE